MSDKLIVRLKEKHSEGSLECRTGMCGSEPSKIHRVPVTCPCGGIIHGETLGSAEDGPFFLFQCDTYTNQPIGELKTSITDY